MTTKTAVAAPDQRVRCRYLRRSGDRCTGQVTDENAEILLCSKHLALALELIRAGMKRTGITRAPGRSAR